MNVLPKAKAIPKTTDHLEQGKYGPIFPKTPACYGFTIIAKVKPGHADTIRAYGDTIEKAQVIAAHESPRTTKLYDRTGDEIILDEVERIRI